LNVKPMDTEDYTNKIDSLCQSKFQDVRENALNFIRNNEDFDKYLNTLTNIYEKIKNQDS
ncbi:MAG: hypothetical protein ABEK36_04790, partial [Candidatus Aenigmatarchaeota archaeon]